MEGLYYKSRNGRSWRPSKRRHISTFIVFLVFFIQSYSTGAEDVDYFAYQTRSAPPSQERPRYVTSSGSTDFNSFGPWEEWRPETDCSRHCGGGVASDGRYCRDPTPEACDGPSRRYYSCNTHKCPAGTPEFRAEQCSTFDSVIFEGRYYEWIPYTKSDAKCELNCMPKGERFYFRQKRFASDGTECDDGHICVAGECLPIGCDNKLGSTAREDKCRKCGGNGLNCKTVDGTFDDNNLQVGYNDILLIPAGATNIVVKEVTQTNNYLALRNTTSHFYLNGNWRIDFPREMSFAGTEWIYERKAPTFYAPESIKAQGPISESIYVVVLYQEPNPGIYYEYSIPEGVVLTESGEYAWEVGPWNECNQQCGGGYRSRIVNCMKMNTRTAVHPDLCDSTRIPTNTDSCANEPCGISWQTSQWSQCDAQCGSTGAQYRSVYCSQIVGGVPAVLDDSLCEGEMPVRARACQGPSVCPDWFVGEWGSCSVLCDAGEESRDVTCYLNTTGIITIHPDYQCPQSKPNNTRPCELFPCEGLDWITSNWTGCAGCGSREESRTVYCGTIKGAIYEDTLCHDYRKPTDRRECNTTKQCQYGWYAREWSECTANCGPGHRTRDVFCGEVTYTGINKVNESNCVPAKKYNDTEDCVGEEVCGGEWFTGPWSECSKKCGPGQKTRTILCMVGNETAPVTNCNADSTPDSLDTCEGDACASGADELIPVGDASGVDDEDCDYYDYMEESGSGVMDDYGSGSGDIISELLEQSGSGDFGSGSGDPIISSGSGSGQIPKSRKMLVDGISGSGSGSASGEKIIGSSSGSASGEQMSGSGSGFGMSGSGSGFGTSGSGSGSGMSGSGSGMSTPDEKPVTEKARRRKRQAEDDYDNVPEVDVETPESDLEGSLSGSGEGSASGSGEGSTSGSGSGEWMFSGSGSGEGSASGSGSASGELSGSGTKDEEESGSGFIIDFESGSGEITKAGKKEGSANGDLTSSAEESASGDAEISGSGSGDGSASGTMEGSTSGSASGEMVSSASGSASGEMESSTSGSASGEMESSASGSASGEMESSASGSASGELESSASGSASGEMESSASGSASGELESSASGSASGEMESSASASASGELESSASGSASGEMESSASGSGLEGSAESSGSATGRMEGSTEISGSASGMIDLMSGSAEGSSEAPLLTGTPVEVESRTMCKPRTVNCTAQPYGCCPNGKDAAKGPFGAGCKIPKTCAETKFGCCPDGVSPAKGKNKKTCKTAKCSKTLYGCCSDKKTARTGNTDDGCEKVEDVDDDATTPAPEDKEASALCSNSKYKCCDDGVTAAHGPNKEGCCLNTEFGCCADNITPKQGPYGEGCNCTESTWGCCPDNVTASTPTGCGCKFSEHGCCEDGYTNATGAEFEGCPCFTFRTGCCDDGVTIAKGVNKEGCGCDFSPEGCCPDGKTPKGNRTDCGCEASEFGCCPDGATEATGENFGGCGVEVVNPGEVCGLERVRGSCRNFTVKWFFDMEYGGCSRFWWGGCEGNGNRFNSQDECKSTCVEPEGRDACLLPRVPGPCEGYYPSYYYDSQRELCAPFIYGGCLGNNNRFGTRAECENRCLVDDRIDPCDTPLTPGPCKGNYTRFYFDKEAGKCIQFTYGGCKASPNNFLTENECNHRCSSDGRTRAFLERCISPPDPGPCNATLKRYAYDPHLAKCVKFTFSGCGGNSNRFVSKFECDLVCSGSSESCYEPRSEGQCPDYSNAKQAVWYYDGYESRCLPFYYTGCGGTKNRFSSKDDCEVTCPSALLGDPTCTLSPEPGTCSSYTERYYYDSYSGACRPFIYSGCGANANNFGTIDECRTRCDRNVKHEEFDRRSCLLNSEPGHCTERMVNWFYDTGEGVCREFEYSGCAGNGNRFGSREECDSKCRDVQDPCILPVLTGPCSGNFKQYYYNQQYDACSEFRYSGCQGNANRFDTLSLCEDRCKRRREETPAVTEVAVYEPERRPDRPGRPEDAGDHCNLPPETGPCRAAFPSFYYNPENSKCEQFVYGGCAGNYNRFNSVEECEQRCGEYKGRNICNDPSDIGPCRSRIEKYYFSPSERACNVMYYGGCGGNGNRFSTRDDCERVCHPEYERLREEREREREMETDQPTPTIPPTHDGQPDPDDSGCDTTTCATIQCPYGVQTKLINDCHVCSCYNPCRSVRCQPGTRCAIELNAEQQPVGYCVTLDSGKPSSTERTGRPPQIITPEDDPSQILVQEGTLAEFECLAQGTPEPRITWEKDGYQISTNTGRYHTLGTKLQLVGAYMDDSGMYSCVATNQFGVDRRDIELVVEESGHTPTRLLPPPQLPPATIGMPYTIRCFALGFPRPQVTWFREDVLLPFSSQDYEQLKDYTLLLKLVEIKDLGPYTCQAYNGYGRGDSWTIIVEGKRGVGVVVKDGEEEYGKYLVEDTGEDGGEAPVDRAVEVVTESATLLPTTPSELETTTVSDYSYPVPLRTRINMPVTQYPVGSSFSIQCEVEGYPPPMITWYKDDVPIDNRQNPAILTVSNAQPEDGGSYQCVAKNDYSSGQSYVDITVQGPALHPNCTDNPFFANCALIVKASYCTNKYYARFCCRSCTVAGQLPAYGPHLSDFNRAYFKRGGNEV